MPHIFESPEKEKIHLSMKIVTFFTGKTTYFTHISVPSNVVNIHTNYFVIPGAAGSKCANPLSVRRISPLLIVPFVGSYNPAWLEI